MSDNNPTQAQTPQETTEAPVNGGSQEPKQLQIDPGELAAIDNLKRQAHALAEEIKRLEIEKLRMFRGFELSEERVQEILRRAGARLGIPDGVVFQLGEEGKIYQRTDKGLIPLMEGAFTQ